jgi:hypothetical protein
VIPHEGKQGVQQKIAEGSLEPAALASKVIRSVVWYFCFFI